MPRLTTLAYINSVILHNGQLALTIFEGCRDDTIDTIVLPQNHRIATKNWEEYRLPQITIKKELSCGFS